MGDLRKTELYDGLARVGHALASGRRLELLDLLAQGPRGVAELANAAGLKLTTASAHLQVLRRAGLVRTRRAGTSIHYSLADDDVAALYLRLREVATAQLPDVDRARNEYLGTAAGNDTEEVGRDELLRRVDAGEVIVLDVRPEVEYRAGHVPGALCIPIEQLAARLDELPVDIEVVAYCRGAYCVFAHDAVRLLRANGRRAVRLEDGMVEWRLAAYPVAA